MSSKQLNFLEALGKYILNDNDFSRKNFLPLFGKNEIYIEIKTIKTYKNKHEYYEIARKLKKILFEYLDDIYLFSKNAVNINSIKIMLKESITEKDYEIMIGLMRLLC